MHLKLLEAAFANLHYAKYYEGNLTVISIIHHHGQISQKWGRIEISYTIKSKLFF